MGCWGSKLEHPSTIFSNFQRQVNALVKNQWTLWIAPPFVFGRCAPEHARARSGVPPPGPQAPPRGGDKAKKNEKKLLEADLSKKNARTLILRIDPRRCAWCCIRVCGPFGPIWLYICVIYVLRNTLQTKLTCGGFRLRTVPLQSQVHKDRKSVGYTADATTASSVRKE